MSVWCHDAGIDVWQENQSTSGLSADCSPRLGRPCSQPTVCASTDMSQEGLHLVGQVVTSDREEGSPDGSGAVVVRSD